jgi:hypothetical protein
MATELIRRITEDGKNNEEREKEGAGRNEGEDIWIKEHREKGKERKMDKEHYFYVVSIPALFTKS